MARLHKVDGLRTLAMSMVIAQHCGLLPLGWTGVWLFFVISGYVITRGFVAEEAITRAPTATRFASFMKRRAVRILPVYLVYLAVGTLLLVWQGKPLGDLIYLLTMTYNWQMIFGFWPGHIDFGVFGHLWTLSVEEQFYLLFPFLALIVPLRARLNVTIALVCAGPFIRLGVSRWLTDTMGNDDLGNAYAVYAATPCHLDAFLMGSLVARLEPSLRKNAALSTGLGTAALVSGVAYAVSYAAVNRAHGARGADVIRNIFSGILFGNGREIFVYLAVDLLATALLVFAVLDRKGTHWLGWRPLAWAGRISYGGYLFHALLLWLLYALADTEVSKLPVLPRIAFFVAVWCATVALAGLSYFKFELPLARRWSTPRAESPEVRNVPISPAARAVVP